MGDTEKLRFYELDHESKMRLLKTYSHTSNYFGYEARKTRRKTNEGKRRPYDKVNHHQNPAAYRRCGGGGARRKMHSSKMSHRKGAMTGQTIVGSFPRTVWWGRGETKKV